MKAAKAVAKKVFIVGEATKSLCKSAVSGFRALREEPANVRVAPAGKPPRNAWMKAAKAIAKRLFIVGEAA